MSSNGQRNESFQVTSYPRVLSLLERIEPGRLLLATDYDGTLSEIVPNPAAVRTVPLAYAALERLNRRLLRVAIISGRATDHLDELLPIEGLIRLGDYGLGHPDDAERAALDAFNRAAAAELGALPWATLEVKPGSTTIHFRERPEAGDELLSICAPIAEKHELEAELGRMVVEVRPPRAGKGKALQRLVEQLQPDGVIFAGDDEGDRPAFEYTSTLERPHLAIGVRSGEVAQDLFEACDLVLEGPIEFSRFLDELAAWADRPGPERPGSGA